VPGADSGYDFSQRGWVSRFLLSLDLERRLFLTIGELQKQVKEKDDELAHFRRARKKKLR